MSDSATPLNSERRALRLCERGLRIADKHAMHLANFADPAYRDRLRLLQLDIGTLIGRCAELTRLIAADAADE
jgi:hypothetical protein